MHGPVLFFVKAPQALLDRPRTGFDVACVLGDFLGDSWNFIRAPRKHILVVLEEVNELAFLFEAQTCPDLHGFGKVSSIDLYVLGILVRLENGRRRGHCQAGWHCRYPEAELP
jgi:hypothetical protein